MRRNAIFLLALLAGCAPRNVAHEPPPRLPDPPAAVAPPPPPPRPAPPVGNLAPAAALRDGEEARNEALRYAAWPQSRTENVQTLVPLTANLTRAMREMRASRWRGRYDVAQTRALRAATDALDDFLQHKRD